jgi:SAM-dependent methyltransferase
MSLRKIYYTLPAAWRLFARQVLYWPEDAIQQLLNAKDDLIPPRRLIYTGRGDFLKTGMKFASLAIENAKLQADSHILDIGCGIGRLAIPLTNLMSAKGRYHGFDIMKPGIDWCQRHISSVFPQFTFEWVDLRNDLYREKGISSLDFSFSNADESKDLIFSISVFTHMIDNETIHYLNECMRVLKPGGYVIASFFVIDDKYISEQCNENKFKFPHDRGHYFLMNENLPAGNVAFLKSYLESSFYSIGFTIEHYFSGHWKSIDKSKSKDFQDIYILKKRSQ